MTKEKKYIELLYLTKHVFQIFLNPGISRNPKNKLPFKFDFENMFFRDEVFPGFLKIFTCLDFDYWILFLTTNQTQEKWRKWSMLLSYIFFFL